jgi:DNA (cytosine-5)-methyltransferase 1
VAARLKTILSGALHLERVQKVEIFEMFSGIGTLTRALVDGMCPHVDVSVVGCAELEAKYLRPWSEQHREASTFAGSVGVYHASELSLVKKSAEAVRVLVAGIPCTGASVAGLSKGGLSTAEEHDDVGHLFLYVAHYIRRHLPDVVVFENVIPYIRTMSADALRDTLRHSGYEISEYKLDSYEQFAAPTQRKRWALVASRIGAFNWEFKPRKFEGTIEQFLDAPSELDELESAKPHQVEADARYIARKKSEGCGWRTVILDRDSPKAPTFVKTYHKRHCVGPFLRTKTSYRMFRPREIARMMGCPDDFVLPESRATAIEVIGQGVHTLPFRSLGDAIGRKLAGGALSESREAKVGQIELALA